MKLFQNPLTASDDFWRARNFLREVFLLNDRLEHSWHVARLDYWRWHLIATCGVTLPFEQVAVGWETEHGDLAAIAHPYGDGEIRAHIHPHLRSAELEHEIFAYIEANFVEQNRIIAPVFADDDLRREVLASRGFTQRPGWNHHYRRDLTGPLPAPVPPAGYILRSMGNESEHPSRSWCSWRAFHSDEPDSNYDGDHSWYKNIQSAPLYRRDLDLVAVAPNGEFAAFCTLWFDDVTRTAAFEPVGTHPAHQRKGLGKAIMAEGLRRVRDLGATLCTVGSYSEAAGALYASLGFTEYDLSEPWVKEW